MPNSDVNICDDGREEAGQKSAPRWSSSTKRLTVMVLLVLLGLLLYRFREVIPPLTIAFLVAFILDPIVGFLVDRLKFSRGLATGVVFVVLILLMVGVLATPVAAVPSIQRAVRTVQIDVTRIINDIGAFFERPLEVADYTFDLSNIYEELSARLSSFVASVAQGTLDLAFGIASGAVWVIFVLITSFYMVRDSKNILHHIDLVAPPAYRSDMRRLRKQVTQVWNAFLRGQLILGTVVAVITTVGCMAVGLPYPWALGLIAGILEFVPNVGPIMAFVPAVLLALFQGSNFLPLSNLWFALVVTGLYILIQQLENNLLVPRILGRSLNLHPLIVLTGIVVGGNLAGILGMLLAAPVLATLRVLLGYIFCRLYDREPFAEPPVEQEPEPRERSFLQFSEALAERLKDRIRETMQGQESEQDELSESEEVPHGS